MGSFRRRIFPAIVAGAIGGSVGLSGPRVSAAEPAQQDADVQEQIKELQAKVEQLKAKQQAAQAKHEADMAELQAQAQKATAASVQGDAEKRSQLLDLEGFTAGYKDDRFFLASSDGRFVLRPWLHFQLRDVTLWRQHFKANGDDDTQNGFEVRRARFGLDGNLFTPDFTYFFNWATVRASGSATVKNGSTTVGTVSNNLGGAPLLEEAWVKYNFHDTPFFVKAGQIKDPLLHDQIVSSRYQQSTERSLTADIFANGDAFTEGATFIYDPKTWVRAEAGINHGLRSANTNFQDFPNTNAFNYGLAGRGEFKLFGKWKEYGQIGAVGVTEPLAVVGVGADYSERGHSGQTVFVADGQYADPTGLSLYGAYVGRYTNHAFGIYTQSATGASIISNPDPAVLNHATYEYSCLLQAGYLIENHWEPFGRFEFMHLAGDAAGSHNDMQAYTAGVNYYFYGHRAKLTGQMTYLPRGIPIDDSPNDVLTSPSGHGEISGVVQFQLLL